MYVIRDTTNTASNEEAVTMKPKKIRITKKVALVSEHTNLAMSEKAEEASKSAGAGTQYPTN
jgi:hypothetical protein